MQCNRRPTPHLVARRLAHGALLTARCSRRLACLCSLWLYIIDANALAAVFRDLPKESRTLDRVRARWACRRMLVRAAERATLAEGREFFGRMYPLYGHQGAGSIVKKAGTLGRVEDNSSAEWWDLEDDSVSDETATRDRNRSSRASIVAHQDFMMKARQSADGDQARKRHRERTGQRDVERAAKLFGAMKLRQTRLSAASTRGDTRERLDAMQAELARIATSQEALSAAVFTQMRDLAVDVKRLAEAAGTGHRTSPAERGGGADQLHTNSHQRGARGVESADLPPPAGKHDAQGASFGMLWA